MSGTTSARRPTADRGASLWLNRNFLLLWVGQGAGALGPQVALVVLPLLALDTLSATAFEVSLLTFLGWLPYLLFSLPAGVAADWFDQRRLMVACDVARLLLILSVPLVAMAGWLTLAYLYAVVFTAGVLTVLFTVAYRAQLPRLVHATQLIDGNGKLGVSERLAELAGPALGGALVGLFGTARALSANVLTFAVSALTLVLIRVPRSAPDPAGRPPFRAAVREGLTFVRRDAVLRALLVCTSVSNFFVMGTVAIQITFMDRDLHASPATIGLVFTVGALGGVAAGLSAPRVTRWVGTARVLWLSMLVPGPLYFLMPLAGSGWGIVVYGVGLAAMSANSTLFNTAALSYRQLVCPPAVLSRVSSVYLWIAYGVVPFGALFGGTLGTGLGLRAALWICTAGMWSAAVWVVFSPLRGMRDSPAPAARTGQDDRT